MSWGCNHSLQKTICGTSVKGVGQIEIDELYVGLDTRGMSTMLSQFQAKGGKTRIGTVQVTQEYPLLLAGTVLGTPLPRQIALTFS